MKKALTFSWFHSFMLSAGDCTDAEEYMAEEGGAILCYTTDEAAVDVCNCLFDIARMSFRDAAKRMGFRQIDVSGILGVPLRTVQDWYGNDNATPHTRELSLYALFIEWQSRTEEAARYREEED